MANKPISMLQIQRVIQLLDSGTSQRNIAKILGISRNTVKDYVLKFTRTGKSFSELLTLSDQDLMEVCYNPVPVISRDDRYQKLSGLIPHYLKELQRTGVTRLRLWEEYCREDPCAYSYQQFCEHLNSHKKIHQAVMHLEHKPGERMEIDFAGKKLSYIDKNTGELIYCPVLVAVLSHSGYTYVEALPDQSMEQLVSALDRCLMHFEGIPLHIVSDNMKQVVTKANRYEPSFTDLIVQWSAHHNTTLLAARVKKPRDKASVEKAVDLAYKRIYAPIRDQHFYSLSELNHHIKIWLHKHNHATLQKKDYSRHDLWLKEKTFLKELPSDGFQVKYAVKAKVQKNYHVTLGQDWHHYSVPCQYIGKEVKIVYDSSQVEIYLNFQRIATHLRNYKKHGYSTIEEHMPEKHLQYKISRGWNQEYFLEKSRLIGESTFLVVKKIISSRQFTEQTYNACLGILRLKDKYTPERVEAACKRALLGCSINYKTINNILTCGLDQQPIVTENTLTIPFHDNIRGAENYSNN